MHKNAMKCNKTQSKWCINKHGASKIIDTFEKYHVRSAIDMMHMTKNLCVNLLGFLGVYGKTKDTPEAWQDQQRMKE
jgi:hypothetical protein